MLVPDQSPTMLVQCCHLLPWRWCHWWLVGLSWSKRYHQSCLQAYQKMLQIQGRVSSLHGSLSKFQGFEKWLTKVLKHKLNLVWSMFGTYSRFTCYINVTSPAFSYQMHNTLQTQDSQGIWTWCSSLWRAMAGWSQTLGASRLFTWQLPLSCHAGPCRPMLTKFTSDR